MSKRVSTFGYKRRYRCGQEADRCSQTHPTLGTDEYIVDAEEFEDTMITFLNDEVPTTSADVFATEATNYDVWSDLIRVRDAMRNGLFCVHPVKSCRYYIARLVDHDRLQAVMCRTPYTPPRAPNGLSLTQAELTDKASNTIKLRYVTVRVLLSARFEVKYQKGIRRSSYALCVGMFWTSFHVLYRALYEC